MIREGIFADQLKTMNKISMLYTKALICCCLFFTMAVHAQEKPEGLFINSKAPDFKGKDQHGREIQLKQVLKDSFAVIVFYRGQWCPYCNRFLKRLEDSVSLLREKGAVLIAVSPEKPENIQKTAEKTGARFSILYDKDQKIMKAYDVSFQVDEATVSRYKNADIDLAAANGQKDKVNLPVPAVYLVSKEGTILYRYFETDYKKRPSVQEILMQIR
jgi:peroxiredoxin